MPMNEAEHKDWSKFMLSTIGTTKDATCGASINLITSEFNMRHEKNYGEGTQAHDYLFNGEVQLTIDGEVAELVDDSDGVKDFDTCRAFIHIKNEQTELLMNCHYKTLKALHTMIGNWIDTIEEIVTG